MLAYRLTNQTHSLTGDILGKEQAVIFTKVRKKLLNSCTAAEHKKAHVSRWVMKRSPPNRSRSSQSEQVLPNSANPVPEGEDLAMDTMQTAV